jgi:large subunit ribosomal protein L5
MSTTATDAPPARLKIRYAEEIRPALIERFGYTSVMQAPRLEKITLNMGVGLAKQDSKVLKAALDQLATIAGQQPSVRRARKSIASFKLREGMPVGVAVTLRGDRGFEFLDRLVSIAIPRIRDFRGLNPRSFDGRGNYSMGVHEQIIFPEIDYDSIDQVRGLDITITTSAATNVEAFALLQAMGMPFATQGRPKGYDPQADEAEAEAHAAAEAAKAAEAANPTPKLSPKRKAPKEAPAAEPEAAAEPAPEAAAEPEAAPEPEAAEASEPEAAAEETPAPEAAGEPEAAAEETPAPEAAGEPEAAAEQTSEPDAASDTAAPEGSTETAESKDSKEPDEDSTEKESSD